MARATHLEGLVMCVLETDGTERSRI